VQTIIGLPEEVKTAVQALATEAGVTDRAEYIAAMAAWCDPLRLPGERERYREEVATKYIPATRARGGPVTTRRRERT
jgi:hypothetical protein